MNDFWSIAKDVLEGIVVVVGIAVFFLVLYLRKHFPTLADIEGKFVSKAKFEDEMRSLREDLHLAVSTSSVQTEKVLRQGIRSLRRDINGLGQRIDRVQATAQRADALANQHDTAIRHVEQDLGEFKAQVNSLNDKMEKVSIINTELKTMLDERLPRGGQR